MKHLKTKTIGKIFLGILILVLFKYNTYTAWYVNGAEGGFGDGSENASFIGNYIVDGAGYFLESYDNTLKFMKKVEWQQKEGLNNDDLSLLLDNALNQMKLAHETYGNLKKLADHTPYNPLITNALKSFKYDEFKAGNGLNGEIMAAVKNYLGKGDICGVFDKILADTGQITVLLSNVKEKLEAGLSLPIEEVWQLNQVYSQSLLFGQYTAQVFANL